MNKNIFFLRDTRYELRSTKGFTLIEILVVVIILGILFTIVLPKVTQRPAQARRMKAVIQMKIIMQALEQFYMDNGFYPSTQQGLDSLVTKPATGRTPVHWLEGGYLSGTTAPLDPWKHTYVYLSPGAEGRVYQVRSLGRDGQEGGSGWDADINSWELE